MTASFPELTAAAALLEREGAEGFRVLRALSVREMHRLRKPFDRVGAYIDAEATGADPDVDEPIQLAIVRFGYTAAEGFAGILSTHSYLREPSRPISAEATAIHGLTMEHVRGQTIDPSEVAELLAEVTLCVAHHASYDRRLLERFFPAFAAIDFGCGWKDVDWRRRGYACSKLVHLLADRCREFYPPHDALADCYAGLRVLTYGDDVVPGGAFAELLANVATPTVRVWAEGSKFAYKDILKEAGYFWADKDRHPPKGCWFKDVPEAQARIESAWLSTHALVANPTLKRITARDRYSIRSDA